MRIRLLAVPAALMAAVALGGPATAATHAQHLAARAKQLARITVWVDATRTPGLEEYEKTHPDAPINAVTIPTTAGYLETKISLDDRAGSGFPDVVFINSPGDVSALAAAPLNFALDLTRLVSGKEKSGFGSSLAQCTFAGRIYCLRDDLGQTALWYNAKEMAAFGYQVPKTWSEYQALGEKVAKQHPGYIIGALGGKWGAGAYFSSSGCETRDAVTLSTVKIDTSASPCTRVAKMLQPLVDDGSVLSLDWSDPAIVQLAAQGKVLMMPGPSWFGLDAFEKTYKVPAGQVAVAPMPTWPGESTPYAGSVGGGMWVIYRHASANQKKAALALVNWFTTNVRYQTTQVTFPAYGPAATSWCKVQTASHYFVGNPCPTLIEEAGLVNPTDGMIRFEPEWWNSYDATIQAAAQSKGSLLNALQQWGSQLAQEAGDSSYRVVH